VNDDGLVVPAAVLGFTTLQRLSELVISRRNTYYLFAKGAHEAGAKQYSAIVLIHSLWLIGLWVMVWGQPLVWPWLVVYFMGQAMRLWVMLTLKGRWTTKIIVLPGAPLVTTGPYRFLRHPNYLAVVVEVAALPLAFGLVGFAAAFSLLNAIMLVIRVRTEDKALANAMSET
jgi:methyltransferase